MYMSNLIQTYFTFFFWFFLGFFDNVSAIRFMLSLVKYHNCFITIFLNEKTGKTSRYKHYLQLRHAQRPFLLCSKLHAPPKSIPFNFQSLCSVYSLLFFPCRALYEESSVLTAICCKSQVHFENTEQYDQHHEKWGDTINMFEHHCNVPGGQWSNGMNEI